MAILHLWLDTYLRAGLVVLLAFALGYPLVRSVLPAPLGLPLSVVMGFGVMGWVAALLAWAGWFTRLAVLVVGALSGAVTLTLLGREVWQHRGRLADGPAPPGLRALLLGAALAAVLLAISIVPLFPSTAFDSTSYHLPLARNLVQHHGLSYDPFVRYSFFPQANEAVFATTLMISPDARVAAGVEFVMLVAAVTLLAAWFEAVRGSAAGSLVAATLALASPVVVYAGTTAFVDVWAMAFLTAAMIVGLYSLGDAVASKAWAYGVVGALIGSAAATKYTGIVFGGAVAAGLLVANSRSWRAWRWVSMVVMAFLVVAVPWYAWTVRVSGDPLYPFATGLFGNRAGLWTAQEIQYQEVVARAFVGPGPLAVALRDLDYFRGLVPHEVGRGLAPLSPWLSPLSPWLGLGFVGALMPSLWRSREWLASTIASIGCVAIWINSTADQRYLIPAIGLLAISGGLVAERAVWWVAARLRAPVRKRWLAPVGAVALPFVVIAGWPSALYVERFVRHNWPPPTSGATVSAYLTARMPCYPGVDYLNRRLGSGYSAYAWGCEQTRYYAKGEYVGDVFSRGSYGRVFLNDGRAMPSDDVLASRLRDLGVQYLIVPTARLGDPGPLLQRGRFQLVYDREQTYVFRLG